MRKYATIPDWRDYSSYRSINCRLLYLHLAMAMDCSTRNYVRSLRQLSDEMNMPFQQLRTALRALERDGLVVTQQATHLSTHRLTQKLTQNLTQIHVLSINELDAASNAASNTASNTATNTAPNTAPNTQKNNINNKTSERLLHTHVRECVPALRNMLEKVLKMSATEAADMVEEFAVRCEIKKKTWESEDDLKAHLVSWCEKHPKPKPKARRTDTQARVEEYQRATDEKESRTDEEKDLEELQRIHSWIIDGEKKLKKAKTDADKARWNGYLIMQREAYREKSNLIKNKYHVQLQQQD